MKRLIIIFYITVCCLSWHLFLFQSVVDAQEGIEDTIDCTDVSVDYSDDPTLTREERLRLMDKAFFDSLNKFELCQSLRKMAETSGTDGGSAEGGSSGESAGEFAGNSVASSLLSGTEESKMKNSAGNMEPGETGERQVQGAMEKSGRTRNNNTTRASGKLPEDIPAAGNDDTLAAQIRYAAENETDPVKKEKLWNEYRKYKGLPPKK